MMKFRFTKLQLCTMILAILLFPALAWAQGSGSANGTAPVQDWAFLGVVLTAVIGFINKTVTWLRKGAEPDQLTKTAIAGFVCFISAIYYSWTQGAFVEFDIKNFSSVVASIGVIASVAKMFYDGIIQPTKKILTQQTNSAVESVAEVNTGPVPVEFDQPLPSFEEAAKAAVVGVASENIEAYLDEKIQESIKKALSKVVKL